MRRLPYEMKTWEKVLAFILAGCLVAALFLSACQVKFGMAQEQRLPPKVSASLADSASDTDDSDYSNLIVALAALFLVLRRRRVAHRPTVPFR